MWDFILNRIPWWIQVGILAVVLGVPSYMLSCMLIGTQRTNKYVLHGIGAIALLGLASKLRQDGYKERMVEEDRATKRAEKVVEDERRKSEALSDEELRKETDLWSKR